MSDRKVLVVDNNPVFLNLMSAFLKKNGCQVWTAENSLAALDIAQKFRPSVIFVDLVMPDIDGAKLCSKMRELPNVKNSRIILISAIAAEQEINYFNLGFDACVAKGPFDLMSPKIIQLLKKTNHSNNIVDLKGIYPREITKELLIIKQKLETTLASISEAVLEITENNRILYINHAAVNIIGKSELELLASDFLSLFSKSDRKKVREILFKDNLDQQDADLYYFLWNGRRVSIHATAGEKGTGKKIIVVKDMTEQMISENELRLHRQFENLVTEISKHFINMPSDHINKGVSEALKQIGQFAGVDRSYIFLFSESGTYFTCTHEWCSRGIKPQVNHLQKIHASAKFPWFFKNIQKQDVIYIPVIDQLPDEAAAERSEFQRQGIRSMINVAMLSGNEVVGFIGFDAVRQEKTWPDEMISLLKIVGEIFVNAINRSLADKALRESERKYRELADLLPQVVFETDSEGNLTFANRQALIYFGDAFLKKERVSIFDFIIETDRSKAQFNFHQIVTGENLKPQQYSLKKRDGSIATMVIHANAIKNRNVTIGMRGVANDITERKRWEDLYRALADKSFAGVYLIQKGRFRYINSNFASFVGYDPAELIGKKSLSLVHPDDKKMATQHAIEMLKGLRTAPYEFRIIRKDGSIRWAVETVSPIFYDGRRAILANMMDLTERKTAEQQLQHLSTHDSLTNLYNRAYFETEAERLEQGRKFPINVLIADIDFLKETNDTLGHWAGDDLLKRTATVLKQVFRKEDVVARIGGDEFSVIWADSGKESADAVLTRIRRSLANHNKECPGSPISLSIGISSGPRGCSVNNLLKAADKKMYEDKALTRKAPNRRPVLKQQIVNSK